MVRRVDSAAGFTLIELMIAVAVLALLSTTVVLSVARPSSGSSQDWVRFQQTYERLRAEATLSRQKLAMSLDSEGFQKMRWEGAGWHDVGSAVSWRDQAVVLEPVNPFDAIAFAPSGQTSRFRVQFTGSGGTRTCFGDGWGPISCVKT